jgi:hypothetical protein
VGGWPPCIGIGGRLERNAHLTNLAFAHSENRSLYATKNVETPISVSINYTGTITSEITGSNTTVTQKLSSGSTVLVPYTTGKITYSANVTGPYTITYVSTVDNITTGSLMLTYPFDNTPPTATISPNGWLQSGTQTINWSATDTGDDITGIKSVVISRKGTNNNWIIIFSKYDYAWGSQPTGSFGISTNTQSIFEYKIDLADQVPVYPNTASLSGDSNNMNVKIDLENPVLVSITSPSDGDIYQFPTIWINGRATDTFSGIKCIQIDLNGNACYSLPISGAPQDTGSRNLGLVNFLTINPSNKLQEGSNTLTCRAEDLSGRVSTSIKKIITYDPPKFIQQEITSDYHDLFGNPLISFLGDTVSFNYKTNINGIVRVSICRDAGGANVEGSIPDTTCTKNISARASFAGGKFEINVWKLVQNGEYYLKAELLDSQGSEFEPPAPKFISQKIKLDMQTSSVTASIKTPANPGAVDPNYRITIPGSNLHFTKQENPMAGLSIAEGDSGFPTPNVYQMPKVRSGSSVLYQVEITKQGYPTTTIKNIDASENSNIECNGFIPFMPGDPNYTDVKGTANYADSDHDDIPDGWEYFYWKNWPDWTPWYGCDLSKKDEPGKRPDGTSDPTYTYDPDGDGLTNLEEYQLQKYFPSILPNSKDLLVELDWVWLDSNDIYAPKDEAKKTCSDAFQRIGITVQWAPAPQGDKITSVNQSTAWRTSVSFGELGSILSSSQGTYEGYTNPDGDVDIAHAVFAPGWTTITGLSNSPNASAGGLYLRDQHGVFVFDLRTRNLVDGQTPADSGDNVLINRYEGYILAHELGHALGLPDVGDKK